MLQRRHCWSGTRLPAGAVLTPWIRAARAFVELYLPLCQPLCESPRSSQQRSRDRATRIVAHLGQSLDGCIATHTGDSARVTGPDNIMHLHRMRALSDAVIVGAGTVANDDPQLTTRLVAGAHAVRVVLDPEARLGLDYQLFRDGAAPTLLCRMAGRSEVMPARAEVMEMPVSDNLPDLGKLGRGPCGTRIASPVRRRWRGHRVGFSETGVA